MTLSKVGWSGSAGAFGVAAVAMAWAAPAIAADPLPDDSLTVSPVVVTATRVAESSADLPASIDRVDRRTIEAGQLQVNLSESLATVPGVSAESRQNYAQDLQLSVRGFGARSSFGVRGIRLYSDGIPGTMPDGQGQFSQFDLSSADHIEVLRGPFSALYGNSSGGVIAVFTEEAPAGHAIAAGADYGAFNTQRYDVKTTGDDGVLNYVLDASHFQTDGFRYHSDAERNLFNAKVRIEPTSASTLTWVGNVVMTPFVQDPLGLTRAQLAADPRQAGVGAIAYDTRKSLSQEQTGVIYEARLSAEDGWTATAYTGHRSTTQYQAIPQATEASTPLNPGGVIDLSRAYYGFDAHFTDQRDIAGMPLRVVVGASYDDLAETRLGFLNYAGSTLGVAGAVRRDEANHVYDSDQYLQAQWDPAADWRLLAGLRNSAVDFSSHDHLAGTSAPDSSVSYAAVNPVAGITFRVSSSVNAYAAFGRGFETPTLDDLAYRSTNGSLPGLNTALKAARSDDYELGVKAASEHLRGSLAGFYIRTTDELSVLANADGRSVEQNIGETSRHGAELSLDATAAGGASARLAYTYLRALVVQPYYTCTGAPCSPPAIRTGPPAANDVLVPSGSTLPAVPRNALYVSLSWTAPEHGFSATLETQGRGHIEANDLNSAFASGYWVTNLRAGLEQQSMRWRLSEYASLDNLANRSYVGSVIVNASNARFFEPAPGRTAYLMFKASFGSR